MGIHLERIDRDEFRYEKIPFVGPEEHEYERPLQIILHSGARILVWKYASGSDYFYAEIHAAIIGDFWTIRTPSRKTRAERDLDVTAFLNAS